MCLWIEALTFASLCVCVCVCVCGLFSLSRSGRRDSGPSIPEELSTEKTGAHHAVTGEHNVYIMYIEMHPKM